MSAHEHTTTHEHGGPKVYIATLAALLVLTVVTVYVAGFDFGNVNIVVAIAIATVKASLVVLIFMHLRHDKPVNAIIAISGFLFLGLLLLFSLLDIGERNDPTPGTLKVKPRPAATAAPVPASPAH